MLISGRINLRMRSLSVHLLQKQRILSSLHLRRYRHINRRQRMVQQKLKIKGLVLILILPRLYLQATLLRSGLPLRTTTILRRGPLLDDVTKLLIL